MILRSGKKLERETTKPSILEADDIDHRTGVMVPFHAAIGLNLWQAGRQRVEGAAAIIAFFSA